MKNKHTKITKDTILDDIVQSHPQAAEVMFSYGLHCIGCQVSAYETLEQGASVHGMTKKEVESLMKDLNALTVKKVHTKNGITISDNALKKIKELQKQKKQTKGGLQIECITHKNKQKEFFLEWIKKPLSFHHAISFDNINLFLAKEDIPVLKKLIIDYDEKEGNFLFTEK